MADVVPADDRLTVWEDATSDGLVEVVPGDGPGVEQYVVRVTRLGREVLASERES